MDAKQLPARPSLEQYKKQAKDLVKSHKSGDPRSGKFVLADAQFAIAREHGFESWPKFAKHVEALERAHSHSFVWSSAEKALIAGDPATLERLLREHQAMFREQRPPSAPGGLAPDYSGDDAQAIIVRNHQFERWEQFELSLKNPVTAKFETAVDAIVAGDVAALRGLLRENPALVRARSTRRHHATLLHYVGANGVEYFRQRTPKNAVEITKTLLDAGAEIDAEAKMYGGSKTLGLVATSIHPVMGGVQDALMETLLDRGAALDGGSVNSCLANGRPRAAEFLAGRGARLDLEGAAGVGRLDLVKGFFHEDGSLKAGTTKTQMKSGLDWACEYGRTSVVDFLLAKGIGVGMGLHWAAFGGHFDIVKLLLERNAAVDAKDERWKATPLSWALHGWGNTPSDGYYQVVALLVGAGAKVEAEWTTDEKVRDDPRMLAALGVLGES